MSLNDISPQQWDAIRDNTAHRVLEKAKNHMQDRATTYDCPEGERSMRKIVDMFNQLIGGDLSEEEGWLFMTLVKMVRSQQGKLRMDSYEDGAAYFALAGETAYKNRNREAETTKLQEAVKRLEDA